MVRIRTNPVAIDARTRLDRNIQDLDKSNRLLATGDRILKAAYDPAGLIISEGMRSRIRSYGQAQRNANDTISLIQVAEGNLSTIQSMASRMRELAIQSANDTLSNEDRARVDIEFQNMKKEIKRLVATSDFNGRKLLDGSAGLLEFQVGINNKVPGDQVKFDMNKVLKGANALSMEGVTILTKTSSQNSLNSIDSMLTEVSGARAFLGGLQNRVQSMVTNLQISRESTAASNSRIRDADYAAETAQKAINTLKTDASTSMLQQSYQIPERARTLLKDVG